MKFEEQRIIVKLGEGEDEARIIFKEPLENERLKMVELGKENLRLALQIIYNNCIDVENLFYLDQPITHEDVRGGNVPGSMADAIAIGYYAAVMPKAASEKND